MAFTAHAPPRALQPRGGNSVPSNPITNAANQIQLQAELARRARAAVDRQAGNATGGPGKPLTLPHDWSGFDKTFAPQDPNTVLARHPNIQTTQAPANPTDLASSKTQGALNAATGKGGAVAVTPTGNDLASGYGTGQSHFVPSGTPQPAAAQTAAATTPTGVQHDWQQEIMAKFPAIGIKGSQANVDFVNAHKAATAQQGPGLPPVDPHQIAQNVMDNIAKPATNPLAPATGVAAINPDVKAPTGLQGPNVPAPFAGSNVGPADWTNPDTSAATARASQSSGQSVGAAARSTASSIASAVLPSGAQTALTGLANVPNAIKDATSGAGNAMSGIPDALSAAYNYAKGAFHGFIHGSQNGDTNQSTPSTPDWAPQTGSFPLTDPATHGAMPYLSLGTGVSQPPPALTPRTDSTPQPQPDNP